MALYKDASGQLVIAASLPPGGASVLPAASGNLVDTAPWLRALDSNNGSDWHPANYYGASGEATDALSGFLTRPAVTLPANASGVVSDFTQASGDFLVFMGGADVTANCSFSSSGATNLTASINSAGAYSATAMSAAIGSITFTATYKNASLALLFTVAKATAGAAGGSGADGTRGSGEFYTSGSLWNDATANSAVTAIYPAGKVYGDTVTISNGSTFAMTKYWNGSAWVAPGTVIDGNLLVSGSVSAAKINANGLSIRDPSGNIILNAGGMSNVLDWAALASRPGNLSALTGAENIKNNLISINSAGVLSGAGGGSVTYAGLGGKSMGQIDQLTSFNISTYIASAAIGSLQVAGGAITAPESASGGPTTITAKNVEQLALTLTPVSVDLAINRIILITLEISTTDSDPGYVTLVLRRGASNTLVEGWAFDISGRQNLGSHSITFTVSKTVSYIANNTDQLKVYVQASDGSGTHIWASTPGLDVTTTLICFTGKR
ncbi:hypothetical protein [Methylomicrobium sp. Wu6]|uniref:hypothetical protein n=1 Tax=Methylomicrobium sp. Wu6 TaxID=3107928 RepID=UPI002DD6AA6D|nr:hypothetical protein [Methylomicrobium sp. Wu6]MEC4750056.1 hypothetical protein [Methylomicrobium sp. Wu6]